MGNFSNPLCPEPIIKQDSDTKNDCERNASRRLLTHFRQEHPKFARHRRRGRLEFQHPHLADLHDYNLRFIIGIKPGSHAFLFEQMRIAAETGQAHVLTLEDADGTIHH